jgi:hypothetical protein
MRTETGKFVDVRPVAQYRSSDFFNLLVRAASSDWATAANKRERWGLIGSGLSEAGDDDIIRNGN